MTHRGKYVKGVSGNPKGRPPGVKSKIVSVRESFLEAFQNLGGTDALTEWASREMNKGDFFALISKMLPKAVELTGANGAPLIPPTVQFIVSAKESTPVLDVAPVEIPSLTDESNNKPTDDSGSETVKNLLSSESD